MPYAASKPFAVDWTGLVGSIIRWAGWKEEDSSWQKKANHTAWLGFSPD
jgi:hypothetical protein